MIADIGDRPDGVEKQEAPAVRAFNPLRQIDDTCVRDQRRLEDSIVPLKQDCGEHVKALGG